jgi:hypothetical protein
MARTFGHPGEGQAGRPDLLLDVLVHRPKLCKPAGTMADGHPKKGGVVPVSRWRRGHERGDGYCPSADATVGDGWEPWPEGLGG